MTLRVEAELAGDDGFGTSISAARSGGLWAATTTNVTNIWRDTDLLHSVRVTGHVGGRDRFSDDGSTMWVGTATIDVALGEVTDTAGTTWATARLDDGAVDESDFAVPIVEHAASDRAVVRTEYLRPRGRGAVTTYRGPRAQVLLVDLGAGELVAELDHDAAHGRSLIDASPEVAVVASRHGLHTFEVRTGDGMAAWTCDELVDAVAVSPDSGDVAALLRDGAVVVSDATGRTRSGWRAHAGAGAAAVWSPDGTWLATGSSDGHLTLWSPTGTPLGAHRLAAIRGLGFGPNGALVVAGTRTLTLVTQGV